jgi:2-polyprenyl-3-methyl-5-hydroxy-6-metoxy-1,4-benzoquinol methylase
MKEEDIRPQEMHEKVQELHKKDVKDIIKYKDEFNSVNCPGCGDEDEKFLHKKEGFRFVQCKNCETIYINPRPTPKMLDDFYSNSLSMKYWNETIFPNTEENRKDKIFSERKNKVINFCKKYKSETNKLIDVGAGFGTFIYLMKNSNFFNKTIAIEPSKNLAKSCKKRGLNVIDKPIEKVKNINADVITSFEVIEHLYDPIKFIKNCYNSLSKNGLLILTTPNVKGFELSMLKRISPNYGGPDHLNYYHPNSLKDLLKDNGFEVLETLTPGKLDAELVRKEVINGNIDLGNDMFLKDILVDRWEELKKPFQDFLIENKLSSHMWIVARK